MKKNEKVYMLTKSQLKHIINEANAGLNEHHSQGIYNGQLTVSELIHELQKYDPNEIVCMCAHGTNSVETIDVVAFEESQGRGDYDKVVLYSDKRDAPKEKPMVPDDFDTRREEATWKKIYDNLPSM